MVHFYRLIAGVMLACLCMFASPSASALEVIETYPPHNCNPATHPRQYLDDSRVTSANWVCGWDGGSPNECGWSYKSTFGWDGTRANGLYSGMCNRPPPVYSCTEGAVLGTNASGARTCTCGPGLREYNGKCTATPPNCEAGYVWSDADQACVLKRCEPDEVRVNNLCVKEPPCDPGYVRINRKCVKDKCPKPGTAAGDGWEMSSPATEYACADQGVSFDGPVQYCMIKVVNTMDVSYNGKTFYYGRGTYTGAQCSGGTGGGDGPGSTPGDGPGDGGGTGPGTGPSPGDSGPGNGPGTGPGGGPKPPDPSNPPPPPPPPVPPGPDNHCPPGTQRYSNGNCYAPTKPPTPPDDNGSCPPGSGKVGTSCVYPSPPGKPAPEPPNDDGSCPPGFHAVGNGAGCVQDPSPPDGGGQCPVGTHMVNGSCEWNGGVTPPVGGGGGSGNGNGDGDGDGKSGFAGTCKTGFACEGDAIQCAIAKEQHIMNCKLLDTENADPGYKAAIDGSDAKSADKLRENAQQVNVSNFDSSGLGWSRACPADPSFDVVGHSFTIPFSKVCGPLQVLAMASVGLTLLSCLMWVVGRKD